MPSPRTTELKVGIFVLVCLVIGGFLIMKFGKTGAWGEKTYEIIAVFPNANGIIKDAAVLYAGIPIGKVRDIRLDGAGLLKVRVTLAIHEGVAIRQDAKFIINQSGLLGDRYVDVVPQGTSLETLAPGAEVEGTTSVDLSEAIRSVVEVLHQAAVTIERVDKAIARVDEIVLSTQSLNHVALTLANLDTTTSNTVHLTAELHAAVTENRQRIETLMNSLAGASVSVSNTVARFGDASENVVRASKRVDDLVADNEKNIQVAARNVADSAQHLNSILTKLEKGEGTAGKLLVDPTLHDELVRLVENWRKYGLLYKEGDRKPKPATTTPQKSVPITPTRPADKK